MPVGRRLAYPEAEATGFSRKDGTVHFYTRVRALLPPRATILDLGAGRGAWTEDPVAFRRGLRDLRGEAAEVVAVDLDPVVLTHPACDRALVMPDPATIPVGDDSVDLIVSDHTFEHVTAPSALVTEMHRVLRPGGWVCARTPNKYGYIGLATNLIPNSAHVQVLRRAQPRRKPEDVFPTAYLMNTRRDARQLFAAPWWTLHMYTMSSEPAYFGTSPRLIRAVDSINSRLPEAMGATWEIFAQSLR